MKREGGQTSRRQVPRFVSRRTSHVEPTVGLVGFSALPGDVPREEATAGMAGGPGTSFWHFAAQRLLNI